MNTHEFFTLTNKTRTIAPMRNGVWEYPEDFIARYNAQRAVLLTLAADVATALEIMTKLEAEQNKYTAMRA